MKNFRPYSANPRRITARALTRLRQSLQELGDLGGVVYDENSGQVVGGHQRLRAMFGEKAGEFSIQDTDIEIVKSYPEPTGQGTTAEGFITWQGGRFAFRRVRWDEPTFRRANFVANTQAGDFDWSIFANTISIQDLQSWQIDPKEWLAQLNTDAGAVKGMIEADKEEPQDAEPGFDIADELLKKWCVVDGDLWGIGNHKLYCGDSIKSESFIALMGNDRARLIWTDPPYGVNYVDKLEAANPMGWKVRQIENDDLPPAELEEFLRSALKNSSEYSYPGSAIYVACPPGTLLPALISAFTGSGFEYRWGLVWLKDQIVLSRADYHFKHENILYGWKPDAAHYFTSDRTQASVFEYPRPKKSDEHPTMKPVELIQHMLRNSSEKQDIVMDMFGGSGSTMLACENENRICRMIEKETKYCSVILERMSTAFPDLEIKRL